MAVITVGLEKFVCNGVPLKNTTELLTKLEPITAIVKATPPAVTLVGLMDEICGTGAEIGNSTEVEAPPPGSGLNTKMTAAPPLSTSPARMLAFNCVALMNVVARGCPPK